MDEPRTFTAEEKLEQLRAFVQSPIWLDILKPTIYADFQIKVKRLVTSTNPQEDYDTKAELRAWGSLLDFERSAMRKIQAVEAELEEQKRLAIQAFESAPEGTPYGR
jgi:hypothetical protein